MTAPWLAASIIRPMIDVPPTVCPSRVPRTRASNSSAHLTNLAEARAWRPLRLRMVTSAHGLSLRSTVLAMALGLAREHLAGDADVFAPGLLGGVHGLRQRRFAAHAGELDQHRQIYARQHLGAGLRHHRNRQVRRRATDHI